MQEFEYYRPASIAELFPLLELKGLRIVAGGTDILPRLRRGTYTVDHLVDISQLDELRFIRESAGYIEIGALATHADILSSSRLQSVSPALVEAVATVGCPQTRQRGTLGGNLVNGSPAADTVPPLLVLGAEVCLVSAFGERNLALEKFLLGPGKTGLAAGEFLHSVRFKHPTGSWGMTFAKSGKRNGMAIALASAAAYLEIDPDGCIQAARLALGSVAPTAVRSPRVEETLLGEKAGSPLFSRAAQAAGEDIAPIDDLRASSAYRRHVCSILIARVLNEAWQRAAGERTR